MDPRCDRLAQKLKGSHREEREYEEPCLTPCKLGELARYDGPMRIEITGNRKEHRCPQVMRRIAAPPEERVRVHLDAIGGIIAEDVSHDDAKNRQTPQGLDRRVLLPRLRQRSRRHRPGHRCRGIRRPGRSGARPVPAAENPVDPLEDAVIPGSPLMPILSAPGPFQSLPHLILPHRDGSESSRLRWRNDRCLRGGLRCAAAIAMLETNDGLRLSRP